MPLSMAVHSSKRVMNTRSTWGLTGARCKNPQRDASARVFRRPAVGDAKPACRTNAGSTRARGSVGGCAAGLQLSGDLGDLGFSQRVECDQDDGGNDTDTGRNQAHESQQGIE